MVAINGMLLDVTDGLIVVQEETSLERLDQDINISKVLGQESGGAVAGFEPLGLAWRLF